MTGAVPRALRGFAACLVLLEEAARVLQYGEGYAKHKLTVASMA